MRLLIRRSAKRLCRPVRTVICARRVEVTDAKTTAGQQSRLDLTQFTPDRIRNFSIVAHVDHGKSTLADRLLEATGTVDEGAQPQMLDRLQVERERGITVKAQTASMLYQPPDADRPYLLNLIDTPGHSDFATEVSRSIAVSDGVLLLVDATQGVQAQTVSNFWLAFEQDLTIVPVLNKMDLAKANAALVKKQLFDLFEVDAADCLEVSAKEGVGVVPLLRAIVDRVPPPSVAPDAPFKALVFDSWFVPHRGVVVCVSVRAGRVRPGGAVAIVRSAKTYDVQEVGVMSPDAQPTDELAAGQVGYVIAGVRSAAEARVGDTLCLAADVAATQPLAAFKHTKPMVFAGLFPLDSEQYGQLRVALDKLLLNDPSVSLEAEASQALGSGWRMGFLGLLHMEVFVQRLAQEYDADVVMTAPSVPYKARLKDNAKILARHGGERDKHVVHPDSLPLAVEVDCYLQPMARLTVVASHDLYETIASLCISRGGKGTEARYLPGERLVAEFRLPLRSIVTDFHDRLKQATSGYGSFDYEDDGYEPVDLVKLELQVNGAPVPEFTCIVPRDLARQKGLDLVERLQAEVPRHQFKVAIQAVIGGKVIARSTLSALAKDVTTRMKGNYNRERMAKLKSLQAKGKARSRSVGKVRIPTEAFVNMLKL